MDDLAPRLRDIVIQAFPDFQDPQVKNLVSLNSGWESDIYAFQAEYGHSSERRNQPLVLRLYSGQADQQKARDEYHTLVNLHRLQYPVPKVFRLDADGVLFDRPYVIMEMIEGGTLWDPLFRGPESRRPDLLRQFCGLFLRLHHLDWRPYLPDEAKLANDPYIYFRRQLENGQALIQALHLPEFQPLLDWLNVRMLEAPCTRPAIIHGDFHPQNILLRPDESLVVIDWTGAAISDLRFDLAWTLLLIESYQGSEWREKVRSEYERQAGGPTPAMDLFDAFACGRRLASVAGSIRYGAGAMGMRPGAEQVMRQQLEPLRRVADRLQAITGLVPVDIDKLAA